MYRGALETLLGFRLRGARLVMAPCIPRAWPGFEIAFRYRSARYAIAVENPRGVSRGVTALELDGIALERDAGVALVDDARAHRIRVVLGP